MSFEPPATPPEPAAGSQPVSPSAPSAPPEPSPAQDSVEPSGAATSPAAPFDPAAVNPLDWAILAAGFLTLIMSFVSYYTGKLSVAGLGSNTASVNAWHGFFGWFAALVALASAALLAVHLFTPAALPFPARLSVLVGFGLSTLCVVVAWFVTPGKDSVKHIRAVTNLPDSIKVSVDYGRGFGFYVSLILIVAGLVMSFLRLRESGGDTPAEQSEN